MMQKRASQTNKYWFIIIMLMGLGSLGSGVTVQAQELLTPEKAVRIGLEQNYAIRIAKNEAEIAQNNNSPGNAGILPRVNASASQNTSVMSSEQEFLTGQTNERDGAQSTSINTGVSLDWTIFDGMRMFTTKSKLQELESQGKLNAQTAIESTVSSIVKAYYEIVRQQQTLAVLQEAVEISRERIEVAKTKKDLGSGSGLELLQAQADFNSDKSAYVQQQSEVNNARAALNQILGGTPEIGFAVVDTIVVTDTLAYPSLE